MTQNGQAVEHRQTRMSRQTMLVGEQVEGLKVLVVGVGGIGSNAAHTLVSMGVHDITLLDFDTVQQENLFPGWFHPAGVGLNKAVAVASQLETFGIKATAIESKIEDFEPDPKTMYDIVIVGTDDIESRALAFKKLRSKTAWWIDGRMGGMGADMFCFHMLDTDAVNDYAKHQLVPFKSNLLCGEKATAYNTKGALMMFLGWNIRDITMENFHPFYMLTVIGERNTIIPVARPPEETEEEAE